MGESRPKWFTILKQQLMERLREHMRKGLVDPMVVDMLETINKIPCLITTSSCEGRLVLLHSKEPLDKRYSRIIGAWHDPGLAKKAICSYELPLMGDGVLWLSLQPPIIHVRSYKLKPLLEIYGLAENAGFSRNCIKKVSLGYMVELKAGDKSAYYVERLNCDLVEKLVDILKEYKGRLAQFKSMLGNWEPAC